MHADGCVNVRAGRFGAHPGRRLCGSLLALVWGVNGASVTPSRAVGNSGGGGGVGLGLLVRVWRLIPSAIGEAGLGGGAGGGCPC